MIEQCRGFLEFQKSLLSDKEYITKIKEIINGTASENTSPLCVPGPGANINMEGFIFDAFLMKIRRLTIFTLHWKLQKEKKIHSN